MAKRIGVIYHHRIARAKELSEELLRILPSSDASGWSCSSHDDACHKDNLPTTDFVVSLGGDGTLLRVARLVAPYGKPIVAVNMGSLGFMSELKPEDTLEGVQALLRGEGWIDERTMLQAELLSKGASKPSFSTRHILNDIVISHGGTPRLIHVKTSIDGAPLTTYRADGIIVSTATGSTAYNLAQGGPILHPRAREIVLNSICPHLSLSYALVLSPTAVVDFELRTDHEAILSVDGQINMPMQDGDKVKVSLSPDSTRLLRIHPPSNFYTTLDQRLRRIS